MGPDAAFDDLMVRLKAGDGDASAVVFRRFVDKLVALAARQFAMGMRERADIEGVVQSVYRSFFTRQAHGQFEPADWEELWNLLAMIALRKCSKRRAYLRAAVRDAAREVSVQPAGDSSWIWEPVSREPTPPQAAALAETVEALLGELERDEREIACGFLQGHTAGEIAVASGCSERTARRLRSRLKHRLRRILTEGG
jgi:DNA-directed RNA polymerase specialized sigma24 family protein